MTPLRIPRLACLTVLIACGEIQVDPDATPEAAEAFCEDYGSICGFGNGLGGDSYANKNDCLTRFVELTPVQRECVAEHVAFADSGDEADNCPSAEGSEPCDAESTFCAQYQRTCGFDNDFGGDPYLDTEDCETRLEALSEERRECVTQHLSFAIEEDESLHCPHTAGEPPCD